MASGSSARRRIGSSSDNGGGILSRVTSTVSESAVVQKGKDAACNAAHVGKKLLFSTGKAAWIAGTTLLILAVPLLIEYERDAQLAEYEMQQASLLGTAPAPPNDFVTSGGKKYQTCYGMCHTVKISYKLDSAQLSPGFLSMVTTKAMIFVLSPSTSCIARMLQEAPPSSLKVSVTSNSTNPSLHAKRICQRSMKNPKNLKR
ncbi:hypothetical protein Cgig2_019079 [Carnegiea gigantea]|uniref:Mitochondrial import receptor subunit TOM22 n=1 Tax=Carnegiea gigantea TaxID=171969 RepID=A0A9Q1KF77_9CARY|nr:hypothetical protein Cgig2_019079 [Carnegiea gigantea]